MPCRNRWRVDVAERVVTKKWSPLACLIPFIAPATLTILRKRPDGQWVIARDANMLAVG
jgi:hypothetical protein